MPGLTTPRFDPERSSSSVAPSSHAREKEVVPPSRPLAEVRAAFRTVSPQVSRLTTSVKEVTELHRWRSPDLRALRARLPSLGLSLALLLRPVSSPPLLTPPPPPTP